MGNKGLDYTALVIAVIGAVNWGLIGLFRLDLVALIFGQMSWISRIIYVIVYLRNLSAYLFRPCWKRKRRISRKYEEASGRKKLFSGGLFSFGGRRAAVLFVKHPPE